MSRVDHHTATVEAAAAWEANHSIGAPTRAEEAYDPHPDDARSWGIDVVIGDLTPEAVHEGQNQ